MKSLVVINLEHVPSEVSACFRTRTAARAVLMDAGGNVALLSVSRHGYHKLPGGGVDEGESLMEALIRECREEVGCEIKIIDEIGTVTEIRSKSLFKQDSHAWLAEIVGEKGMPDFTESEMSRGFEVQWLPLEEAKRLLTSERGDSYEGQYMSIRDLSILTEAERLIA